MRIGMGYDVHKLVEGRKEEKEAPIDTEEQSDSE